MENKTARFTILIDPRKKQMFEELCAAQDLTPSQVVRQLIRDMAAGRAIVISTHILEEVDAVCSRAVIIDRGRIVADGTADELRKLIPGRRKAGLDEVFRQVTTAREAAGA